MEKESSYTSAGAVPVKVAMHGGLRRSIAHTGRIFPVHVQIMPTNVCNLNCKFCSCANRAKSQELDLNRLMDFIVDVRSLGCEAVTITGGGEPLLYGGFDRMVSYITSMGMEVGLVTNGTKLLSVPTKTLSLLRWCRVSCDDARSANFDQMHMVVKSAPKVDWAFSYVVSDKPNGKNLADHLRFAYAHGFTHVRVVPDLLSGSDNGVALMERSMKNMLDASTDLAIFQYRNNSCNGARNCNISLLKPVLAADGWVYPCCGVQYAKDTPGLDMTEEYRMCEMGDVTKYWNSNIAFDGSGCKKCYYGGYNSLMESMRNIEHDKFL